MPVHTAVLFDLDGTLLDTAPNFYRAVEGLCEEFQLIKPSQTSIRETVSHGARALVKLASQLDESHPEFESYRQSLLTHYSKDIASHTQLFNQLDELLYWLEQQNIAWGIVTNKPRLYSMPLLEQLQLLERCGSLICPDDVSRSKPDPEPLLLASTQLAIPAEHCIYIGDHRRDIEAGNAANMTTIAAAYGYIDPTDPAEHWQADHIINAPEALLPLIQSLC